MCSINRTNTSMHHRNQEIQKSRQKPVKPNEVIKINDHDNPRNQRIQSKSQAIMEIMISHRNHRKHWKSLTSWEINGNHRNRWKS